MGTANIGLQFLSVIEAAEALGVSRMRVREAATLGAIPSIRDNKGQMRIDLSALSAPFEPPERKGEIPAGVLLDILFDEIEDLQLSESDAQREVAMLQGLAGRQAEALDRAEVMLDVEAEQKTRLIGLLDRAMEKLEARAASEARLANVTDRAMDALEASAGKLEQAVSQSARFDSLLERALEYAAIAEGASDEKTRVMAGTAERAMAILDQAMAEAENGRDAVDRIGAMLDRALAAGEQMEREIANRYAVIESRSAAADRALELSERAMALAGQDGAAPQKGFWRRLFGI